MLCGSSYLGVCIHSGDSRVSSALGWVLSMKYEMSIAMVVQVPNNEICDILSTVA